MKQTVKVMVILAIILAIMLVFSGCMQKTGENLSGQMTLAHNKENTSSIDRISKEVKEAVIRNNVQEVDLKINASGYFPDVIVARKDIPLKINVHSDNDADCATGIVFPDFNIEKNIPAGSSGLIEILPSQEGTFSFRCSADMFRGKLVITE